MRWRPLLRNGALVVALGVSTLRPHGAQACPFLRPLDLGAEIARAHTVVKARITDVVLADVVANDRRLPFTALAMTLETARTFKGNRQDHWQVAVREVPTYGIPRLAEWKQQIGTTKIFALDPPFTGGRFRYHRDWGSVPNGAGGSLYEIVSVSCTGRVVVEPDLKTELKIAFIAQRELVISAGLALIAGVAMLVRRSKRKTPPPEQAA